jgi:COMPASS component SWD2
MKFSPNGEYLVLSTSDNSIILLDAFAGSELFKFTNFLNESSIIECSFTPDSKFIISGSENGVVHVWNTHG